MSASDIALACFVLVLAIAGPVAVLLAYANELSDNKRDRINFRTGKWID